MTLKLRNLTLTGSAIVSKNNPISFRDFDNAYATSGYHGFSLDMNPASSKAIIGTNGVSRTTSHSIVAGSTTSYTGYSLTPAFGSINTSQTKLADGVTIEGITTDTSSGQLRFNILVSGLSKASTYLEQISISGVFNDNLQHTYYYDSISFLNVTNYNGTSSWFKFDPSLVTGYSSQSASQIKSGNTYTVSIVLKTESVKIYDISDLTLSEPYAQIQTPTTDPGSYFGKSVAISNSGNRVFIGAPESNLTNNSQPHCGQSYVYNWNGSSWVQYCVNKDPTYNSGNEKHFGEKIVCSDDGLLYVAGTPEGYNSGIKGTVTVMRDTGSTFSSVAKIVNGSVQDGSRFGEQVSINSDGSRIAISAPGDVGGGKIFMYEESPSNTWTLKTTLTPPNGSSSGFGGLNRTAMFNDGSKMAVAADKVYLYTRSVVGPNVYWNPIALPMPLSPTFTPTVQQPAYSTTPTFNSVTVSNDGNTIVASANAYFIEANRYVNGITNKNFSATINAGKYTNLSISLADSQVQTCGFLSSSWDGTFTTAVNGNNTNPNFGTTGVKYSIYNSMNTDAQNQTNYASCIELKFHGIFLPSDIIDTVSITGVFGYVDRTVSPYFEQAYYSLDPSRTTVLSTTTGASSDGGKSSTIQFSYSYLAPGSGLTNGSIFRWTFDNKTNNVKDTKVNLFVPGNTYKVVIKLKEEIQGRNYIYKLENGGWRIKEEKTSRDNVSVTNSFGSAISVNTDGSIILSSDYVNNTAYLSSSNTSYPLVSVIDYNGSSSYTRIINSTSSPDIVSIWNTSGLTQMTFADSSRYQYNNTESANINYDMPFGVSENTQSSSTGVRIIDNKNVGIHYSTSSSKNSSGSQYEMMSISKDVTKGMNVISYTGTLNTYGYYLKVFGSPLNDNGRKLWYFNGFGGSTTTGVSTLDNTTIRGKNIRKIATGPYSSLGYADSFVVELYGNHLSLNLSIVSITGVWNTSGEITKQTTANSTRTLYSDGLGTYTEFVFNASSFINYGGVGGLDFNPNYKHYYINFDNNSVNATSSSLIAHGLGAVPSFYMTKCTDLGSWFIWHKDIPNNSYYLTDLPNSGLVNGTVWPPTSSSLFTSQHSLQNTKGRDYVSYVFKNTSHVDAGSYTGTGVVGLTISTISKPTVIFIKCKTANEWTMIYTKDGNQNEVRRRHMSITNTPYLSSNTFGSSNFVINETDNHINGSGLSYVYIAISGAKTY